MVINVVPDLACVRCINSVGHASFNVSKACVGVHKFDPRG